MTIFRKLPVTTEHMDLAGTLAADLGTAAPDASTSVLPPAKRARTDSSDAQITASSPPSLDCYPYTFSPLLLFSSEGYFDKGYSNYNAVARFFDPVLQPGGIDMLENVLYDRKNMLYEDLLAYVTEHRMFIPCCIDAHFTAFQVLGNRTGIYYDPLSPHLQFVSEGSYDKLVGYLLIKCNLGDSLHMQENRNHYRGQDSTPLRRMLYDLWKNIHTLEVGSLHSIRMSQVDLELDRYVLINSLRDPSCMSCQLTGNT